MGRAAAVVALVAHTEFAFLLVLFVPTFFVWRAVFGAHAVAGGAIQNRNERKPCGRSQGRLNQIETKPSSSFIAFERGSPGGSVEGESTLNRVLHFILFARNVTSVFVGGCGADEISKPLAVSLTVAALSFPQI